MLPEVPMGYLMEARMDNMGFSQKKMVWNIIIRIRTF